MGGRNRCDFSVGDRSRLDFSAGITINLCRSRKCLGFRVGGHAKFKMFHEWGSKLTSRSVLESTQTWFCERNINKLGFSVWTEVGNFCVRGSKLTLFLRAGRKLLVFRVSVEIDLVLVMIEIDLISV